MDLPLVSILINNYNYSTYLNESINSALEQTYSNLEIIVVDDGSQDNSAEIIHSYREDQILPIFKENGGQASAFNAGFEASSGEIICFLDADDFFYSKKISQVINVFFENPDIGWLFHQLSYVDANSQILEIENPAGHIDQTEIVNFQKSLKRGKRLTRALPATSGLCFSRNILQKILPMPCSGNVTISDNYLKYAALALSSGILLAEHLAAQRIHGQNLYTFRDNSQLRAEINIKTGFYLRQKFPDIYRFADKRFAEGCGEMLVETSWSDLLSIPEFKAYFRAYGSLPILAKNSFKTLLQVLRFRIRKFLVR